MGKEVPDVICESKSGPLAWMRHPEGLEGVRQKGWTIVGSLCILREGTSRNTRDKILVQGDNQAIIINYRRIKGLDLVLQFLTIGKNNNNIMKCTGMGVKKL